MLPQNTSSAGSSPYYTTGMLSFNKINLFPGSIMHQSLRRMVSMQVSQVLENLRAWRGMQQVMSTCYEALSCPTFPVSLNLKFSRTQPLPKLTTNLYVFSGDDASHQSAAPNIHSLLAKRERWECSYYINYHRHRCWWLICIFELLTVIKRCEYFIFCEWKMTLLTLHCWIFLYEVCRSPGQSSCQELQSYFETDCNKLAWNFLGMKSRINSSQLKSCERWRFSDH